MGMTQDESHLQELDDRLARIEQENAGLRAQLANAPKTPTDLAGQQVSAPESLARNPATEIDPLTPQPPVLGDLTRSAHRRLSTWQIALLALLVLFIGGTIGTLFVSRTLRARSLSNSTNQVARRSAATPGSAQPAGKITEFVVGGAPSEIAAGPDRNLWFTETLANKIGRITPSGTVTEFAIPTPYSDPEGITAGSDGNLWFTELGDDQIVRMTPSGIITGFPVPTPESGLYEIVAGPDGNLWFTESNANKIGRITPNGTITEFSIPTSPSSPVGITTGPDGNLWFTESETSMDGSSYGTGQIGRITPSGTIAEYRIPTSNSNPEEITTGPNGDLWFTQSGNKIGRITSGK